MLRRIPAAGGNLRVGPETGDDAAVWCDEDGRCLVSTADFFPPIVDDPATWGRIAATNAASDVYAMGGTPLFALNLVVWPREVLSLDVLGEVLEGGAAAAAEGGWVIAGGHTVDGPEPVYGQAVTGQVQPADLLTNAGGQPGMALVLTKPLGTGLVSTAVKRAEPADVAPGGWLAEAYEAAVAEMTRLNAEAAQAARAAGSVCATDITGFGLLGHLRGLLAASGTGAVLDAGAVPTLPGAWGLLDEGYVPGGTRRNLEYVSEWLRGDGEERTLTMLADAQTSGGLLFACPPEQTTAAVRRLGDTGHTAAVVGELTGQHPGSITVTA